MKTLINCLLISFFLISWFGCEDEYPADSNPYVNEGDLEAEQYNEVISLLFRNSYNVMGETNCVPIIGEVLDETMPTTYTAAVDNIGTAHYYFLNYCTPSAMRDSLSTIKGDLIIDFGRFGTICYVEDENANSYASIIIDLKSIPSVTEIKFIPIEMWPTNSIVRSTFETYDIVKDNVYDVYYICVRSPREGHDGLLISFDDKFLEPILRPASGYSSYPEIQLYRTYEDKHKSISVPISLPNKAMWNAVATHLSGIIFHKKYVEEIKQKALEKDPEVLYKRIEWLWKSDAGKSLLGETAAYYGSDYRVEKKGKLYDVYIKRVKLDLNSVIEYPRSIYTPIDDEAFVQGYYFPDYEEIHVASHKHDNWNKGENYKNKIKQNANAVYFNESKDPNLVDRFSKELSRKEWR